MSNDLKNLISLFISLLYFAILGQVILSWLLVSGVRHELVIRLYNALTALTEPIMRPLRRIVPRFGMMDITPMVAIFLLIIIQQVVAKAL